MLGRAASCVTYLRHEAMVHMQHQRSREDEGWVRRASPPARSFYSAISDGNASMKDRSISIVSSLTPSSSTSTVNSSKTTGCSRQRGEDMGQVPRRNVVNAVCKSVKH
mmetsp:Transcript_25074/g.82701  ORF Transcript_25074/g.82701 Transcript_25074/m.82701 type:complete len:108 (+) Transcript_25074:452-775(+)